MDEAVNGHFHKYAITTFLRGPATAMTEDGDGYVYLPLLDAVVTHESYFLTFDIDWVIAQDRGRELLRVIWQSFYRFLNILYGTDTPVPDFADERDFAP